MLMVVKLRWKKITRGIVAAAILCFLLPLSSIAQNWPFELWYEGKIALENGDTLRGMVKYDLQQDLVQYTFKNSAPEAFTARKILFFEIFDTATHRYRRFFSLPYSSTPG